MKKILKTLIKKRIIDYQALLLEYYPKLGLTPLEAVALIQLNDLAVQGESLIKPEKFAKVLGISLKDTEDMLASLMTQGYLRIGLTETTEGKEKETFDTDYVLVKLITVFNEADRAYQATETQRFAEYLEDTLQRPLSPLDIELISKWIDSDGVTFSLLKETALEALKKPRPSLKTIDRLLLQVDKKPPVMLKKKDVLKEFYKLWDE